MTERIQDAAAPLDHGGLREWDLEELKVAVRRGGQASVDDVSVTRDGRRLDSKAAVVAFLDEVNRERAGCRTTATAIVP